MRVRRQRLQIRIRRNKAVESIIFCVFFKQKIIRRICCLSGRNGLLGKVIELVQVGLDVAVRERLTLLDAENLAHGLIRVDRVALLGILELVSLYIGGERLGDIRGRHLAALGLAEEGAERVTERHGGRKDRGALGNRRRTLNRHGLVAAATTTRLLDLTRNTLRELGERLEARKC